MPVAATVLRPERDEAPTGIQPGRGGFLRGSGDTPYVTVPDGALVKSGPRKGLPKRTPYGSPSGFGDLIDEDWALEVFGGQRAMLGVGREPGLVERAQALAALDPESDEFKSAAKALFEAAKMAGDASLSADLGTHVHDIIHEDHCGRDWSDKVATGEALGLGLQVQRSLIEHWRLMLQVNGLEILASEVACVNDLYRMAGTLDCVARLTRDLHFVTIDGEVVTITAGTILVLDIKTGKRRVGPKGAVQYWHSYSVQVVTYAGSVPYDVEAETRGEWPWSIDQRWALIAHVDVLGAIAGEPAATLVLVDLEAGRYAAGLCQQAKAWGKRTDVFSVAQLADEIAAPADPPVAEQPVEEAHRRPSPAESAPGDPGAGRRRVLTARYLELNDADKAIYTARKAHIDTSDLDAVEALLNEVDPFMRVIPPAAPKFKPVPKRPLRFTGDEGGRVTDVMARRMFAATDLLTPEQMAPIDMIAIEAQGSVGSIGLRNSQTRRRWEIARALVTFAAGPWDDELIRAAVAQASADDAVRQPAASLGAAIGMLDFAQAEHFADIAAAAGRGSLVLDISTGVWRFVAPAPAA